MTDVLVPQSLTDVAAAADEALVDDGLGVARALLIGVPASLALWAGILWAARAITT